ncbi:MAG TPA: endolytic transglycosylase MltG, partial [Bdellovibrio sp.]|nr:endolytic transglycosylase MltG [Bdellovibrio sp.]
MKKTAFVLSMAIAALVFAIVAGASYLFYDFGHTRPSEVGQDVVYEVEPGKSFNTIAKELETKGLIRNAHFFSIYARLKAERNKIKVGEYLLRTNMVPNEILQVLISGKSIARSFTVSEGLSVYEISELYEKEGFGKAAEFMSLVHDPGFIQSLLGEKQESLEGYLFPETYMLTKYTDTKTLITNMVKRFLYVYNEIIPQSEIKGLNRHQIVTLA